MYLIKLSNNVFYTRISTPVALQTSLGYPREIRLSLLTKHRRLASKRNSQLSSVIQTLYEQALTERIPYASFKMDLDAKVAKVRQQFTSNLPNVDNLQSNCTVDSIHKNSPSLIKDTHLNFKSLKMSLKRTYTYKAIR
ncbi:DUF6538 domain-containing protein [Vibrio metschnikovii]|uniref:DUF6538 domain-containing protein n=1 Tax=Vibrio metschnikovii TaxID=28172 RepID=UPI0030C6B866